ncbi:MAG TPA: DMT family transporter [Burkholderiaceae bacterium]|nr:DMT family transporter [Burkholderiaceae bacterium]
MTSAAAARAHAQVAQHADAQQVQRRGYALGLLGVALFALTIPMTRLASGSLAAPQLSPWFVASGRAAFAGALAALYLLAVRAPRPSAAQWRVLALTAVGVVFGFPLFMGLAVVRVDAIHASVVTGILPLVTAALGAWLLGQPQRQLFWAFAGVGCLLVVAFAWWRGGAALQLADALLAMALLLGALGYVWGAKLSATMRPEHVISWVLVLALPVTLPATVWTWPATPVQPASWLGFAYVALFSMWLGFFAWYRALALGGTVRVSQVQLLQPFLSIVAALPILGEAVDAATCVFLLAVMGVVFASRRVASSSAASLAPARGSSKP